MSFIIGLIVGLFLGFCGAVFLRMIQDAEL